MGMKSVVQKLVWGVIAVISLAGCGKDNTVVVQGASTQNVLDPLLVQQFATPLPEIPVAVPDTTSHPGYDYYTVVAEQTTGYDFGLRKKDGSEFINPATGGPIRTTVWCRREMI